MKKYKTWVVLSAVIIFLSGCSSEPKRNEKLKSVPSNDIISQSKKKVNHYEGEGIVISITPNKKQVIIKHGVIPGFMEAMTMPFNVPDSSLLAGIHPKDSVKLLIEYDGTNVTLQYLKKAK